MSRKYKTKIFAVLLCLLSVFSFSVPVMAADATLYINVSYSDGISVEADDKFVITYRVKGEEDTATIVLNAAELDGKTGKMDFNPGEYEITNIEYQGYDTDIEKAGYAINSSFVINEDTNNAAFITLAIGEKEGTKLLDQYDNVIVKQYYQTASEFGSDIVNDPEANERAAEAAKKERPITDKKESESSKIKKTESTEKTEKKQEKASPEKKQESLGDHIFMILPLIVIACIVAIVLLVLRKKNKI